MKLLTRYLLANLVRPWLYILFGFSAIAVLVDLFDNFVSFMEAGTPIGSVLLYYAAFVPTYLPFMLPVSLLLALLYALWKLGKNSEITAMRACGLSLWQLARPYLALGLGCSLVLLAVNERFNPRAARWARQFRNRQDDGEKACLVPVAYKNTAARRVWRINTFDIRPENAHEMRGVSLTQQRPDGSDEYRIDADRARWINGHWWFERLDIHRYTALNDPVGAAEKRPAMDMTMLTETPDDFLNETKDIENNESSAADIQAFIQGHPDISDATRARLWVDWNYRLAAPWLCLIVILVGIPFGMQTGRRGMGVGILSALLIFFGYYVMMGVFLTWGKRQLISPTLAGWLPALCFLLLGLLMLRRCR